MHQSRMVSMAQKNVQCLPLTKYARNIFHVCESGPISYSVKIAHYILDALVEINQTGFAGYSAKAVYLLIQSSCIQTGYHST